MGRTNFSSAAGSYLKPWIFPLIAAITYAVFTPVLGGEFLNWDDRDNFLLNEHYRGLGWAQIQWMVSTTHAGLYMPLTWLTFGLNFAVSGMNPFAYHLTSLLLHALNAAVFYVVAKRLLTAALRGSPGADEPPTARAIVPAASVAALLFALHPQRVEPVAWITDRGTLLSGLFYLLAVLAYLRAALGATAAIFARSHWAPLTGLVDYGVGARAALAAYSFWFYPLSFVWPLGLSPLYELPASVDLIQWRFLGPLLGVGVVTASAVLLRHRFPAGLATWVHSVAAVAPVSGVLHSGIQLAADRYAYLAGFGFALLAGACLLWIVRQRSRGRVRTWVVVATGIVATFAIVALGANTWLQGQVWQNSEALWRWAIEQDGNCALCHGALGYAILYSAQVNDVALLEADDHLRRAIALRPTMPMSYFGLGMLRLRQGRYREAETSLQTFVKLEPARREGYDRLALVYLAQNRPDEALALLGRSGDIPRPVTAWQDSRGAFAAAVALLGNDVETLQYLGQALIGQGRAEDAIVPLRRAAMIVPRVPGPRFWLARAYEAAGDAERARQERAVLQELTSAPRKGPR
ncbi:MAG: hypothetical protein DME08_09100 [Candidatus Rokuibacteriota bacterium]|nr:MAG: hypothetical protein DME08_09100 [Candidatus Rokubacteria bacterium]